LEYKIPGVGFPGSTYSWYIKKRVCKNGIGIDTFGIYTFDVELESSEIEINKKCTTPSTTI